MAGKLDEHFGSRAATSPSSSRSRTPAPVEAVDISDLATKPPPQVDESAHDPTPEAPPAEDFDEPAPQPITASQVSSIPPPPRLPPRADSLRDSVPDSEKSPAPLLTPAPGEVMSELDRIARRSKPSRASGPSLSPNLTALIGGLVGLTFIVTLGLALGRSQARPIAQPVETKPAPAPEETKTLATPVERKKEEGPWRVMDDAEAPGKKVIGGKIGKQAFLRAIQDAGLPKSEAYRAYTALKGLLDLDHCKSTDEFLALINTRDKKLLGFEYVISKEEVYQAKPNEAGHLQGEKLDLKVARNQIRRAFAHDGKSFEDSARRAGFDPGLAEAVGAALRGHSALSDFKAGDRFRIIAQEVTVLGEFSRYAGIEAMEILKPGKQPRRIYYYSHPIEGGHFDDNGKAPYEGGWRKPIPDAPVTSKFNMKRMHPVLNKVMPHTGTDFGAPAGTPIGATSPGVVSFIGPAGPSGNLVKVKHDGGYESGYAHLSKFAEGLKVGDHVDRLQLVGYCGSTGRSTGPHLHFTMKKDGAFIDPESLNLDGMRVLAKSHRPAFAEVRAKYDPILDAIPLPEIRETPQPTMGEESEPAPSADADEMGDDAMGDDTDEEAVAPSAPTPRPEVTQTTPATPSAPSAPVTAAKKVEPSAIFLSDEELLRMQSLTDDGEVEQ